MLMRPLRAKAEGRRGKQVVTSLNKDSDADTWDLDEGFLNEWVVLVREWGKCKEWKQALRSHN